MRKLVKSDWTDVIRMMPSEKKKYRYHKIENDLRRKMDLKILSCGFCLY